MTTVGFGDIVAKNITEFSLSFLWMAIGTIYYALLVGQVTSYLNESAGQKLIIKNKHHALYTYNKKNKLPDELFEQIYDFIRMDSSIWFNIVE